MADEPDDDGQVPSGPIEVELSNGSVTLGGLSPEEAERLQPLLDRLNESGPETL